LCDLADQFLLNLPVQICTWGNGSWPMQSCTRIGAFAGFIWVRGRRLWWMLKLAGQCGLAGQSLLLIFICSWRSCSDVTEGAMKTISLFHEQDPFSRTKLYMFRTMKKHVTRFLMLWSWGQGMLIQETHCGIVLVPFVPHSCIVCYVTPCFLTLNSLL
jgi:hypothetical protein